MMLDYALQDQMQRGLRIFFGMASGNMSAAARVMSSLGLEQAGNEFAAASTLFNRTCRSYDKPAFNLPDTQIGNKVVPVTERVVSHRPYGDLVHFERQTDRKDPTTLLVTPMSGHYATLLRGTVEALLPHHNLYVTDWANARDVGRAHGDFGLDSYTDYIRSHLQQLGPHTHVIAVCQPTVPVLAAVALMAKAGDPNQPLSMTLMGGPIDTRAAPTEVTKFAEKHSMDWFKSAALSEVPAGYKGVGQTVYPGFKQLTGFMMMNPERHVRSHWDMFNHLRQGDRESAERIKAFYDEYLAVQDLSGRFYIETVDQVFKRHSLPKGEMVIENHRVNLAAIQNTALFTVEGERDDISAPGQTIAAHRLCHNIPPDRRFEHLQSKVGHYGIFEGHYWREEICPRVAAFIRNTGMDNGLKYSKNPVNTRLIPPNYGP